MLTKSNKKYYFKTNHPSEDLKLYFPENRWFKKEDFDEEKSKVLLGQDFFKTISELYNKTPSYNNLEKYLLTGLVKKLNLSSKIVAELKQLIRIRNLKLEIIVEEIKKESLKKEDYKNNLLSYDSYVEYVISTLKEKKIQFIVNENSAIEPVVNFDKLLMKKTNCKIYNEEESFFLTNNTMLMSHTTGILLKKVAELKNKSDYHKAYGLLHSCYRRETEDATHFLNFDQLEIHIPHNSYKPFETLAQKTIEFLKNIGLPLKNLTFRIYRTHYTAPSFEVHYLKDPSLGLTPDNSIEILGAGVFKKEILKKYGIKNELLAMGLGLKRIYNIIFELNNFRKK